LNGSSEPPTEISRVRSHGVVDDTSEQGAECEQDLDRADNEASQRSWSYLCFIGATGRNREAMSWDAFATDERMKRRPRYDVFDLV
jgi:hypothetical protein